MGVMILIDHRLKPPLPSAPRLRRLCHLVEWCLMPAVGLALSALPGLVAHTRLLLGRYLEYKVTPKLAATAEPRPVLHIEQVQVPVAISQ